MKPFKQLESRVKVLSREDGERLGIEDYPNFHKSGSVRGMKDRYYGKEALLVRCGNYIYNVSSNPEIYELAESNKMQEDHYEIPVNNAVAEILNYAYDRITDAAVDVAKNFDVAPEPDTDYDKIYDDTFNYVITKLSKKLYQWLKPQ